MSNNEQVSDCLPGAIDRIEVMRGQALSYATTVATRARVMWRPMQRETK